MSATRNFISLAALTLAASAALSAASISITIDTSSLTQGGTYNLDLQLNPLGTAQAVTATINAAGTTVYSGSSINTGDSSGALPGTVTLGNTAGFNDVFESFTASTSLALSVLFSGPAIDSPTNGPFGSAFAVSIYDAAGITPLLTSDPAGSLLTTQINPDGTITNQTFPTDSGAPSVVTVTAIPEPATWTLLLLPAALFASRRFRRAFMIVCFA